MTVEQLRINIEELEDLVSSGKDYIQVENKAKELLNELIVEHHPEIHYRILHVLSISLNRRGMAKKALPYAQHSLALTKLIDNKESQAQVLVNIGNIYLHISEYVTAIDYFHQALALSREYDYKKIIAASTGNIGIAYLELCDYPLALEYFSQGILLDEELGDERSAVVKTANIGLVYSILSDYVKALDYYEKALITHEKLGNKAGIARLFSNIGNVYKNLSDFSLALEYYKKSLAIHEELGNQRGRALININLGLLYVQLMDYTRALDYYKIALAIDEEIGNKAGAARVKNNMGIAFWKLLDYNLSMKYLQDALCAQESIGDKSGVALTLGNIGTLYATKDFEEYNLDSAIKYIEKSLVMCEELGIKREQYEYHKQLAQLYKDLLLWEKYSYHIEQYHSLEKEVQSLEVKKQADRFDLLRQIMEKEKARAIAERDGEIQRLKAEELARNIALMKKELEELIERLVRKSQFIRSISGKLEYAMSLTNGESRRAVYSVIELLDERVGDEEDRIVVLLQLRAVYGEFMSRLESLYKELNDGEVKTCALMMMQLSTSKIAITLGVSERTIEKYRSTIRKKLGIAAHGNIVAFLQQFLEEY